MAGITTAFWEFTINNYTQTDLALLAQGYPDQLRQLVYSREVGENGTPHIQGYVRLFRQQRMSYVQKLFPRAHFKAITCEVFNLHAQRYPQKQDATSDGPVNIMNSQFPDPVTELLDLLEDLLTNFYGPDGSDWLALARNQKEQHFIFRQLDHLKLQRVKEKPMRAKFYVSATFKAIESKYVPSLIEYLHAKLMKDNSPTKREEEQCVDIETHTHTHTQPEIFSQENGTTKNGGGSTGNDASGSEDDAPSEECSEDYEDGSCASYEVDDEGTGSDGGSSYDSSSE